MNLPASMSSSGLLSTHRRPERAPLRATGCYAPASPVPEARAIGAGDLARDGPLLDGPTRLTRRVTPLPHMGIDKPRAVKRIDFRRGWAPVPSGRSWHSIALNPRAPSSVPT